jgi:hypothetical protein
MAVFVVDQDLKICLFGESALGVTFLTSDHLFSNLQRRANSADG